MIIPHRMLSPEALQGLLEEFVTRDGTDYGEREASLQAKVVQVWCQLDLGIVVIVFNEPEGTCSIVAKDQLPEIETS
jgi:hypothetical protein